MSIIPAIRKSTARQISKRASINWIILIYFFSGACSLMDEVVWVRLLKLILGNTVYASSIVVSTFMGGLALGAILMSRYADRVQRQLRLYAIIESLITVSALLLPFALKAVDWVYIWFFRVFNTSNRQLLSVQVVISAAILLVPSMLMGSTLPLLGRFTTAFERDVGRLVGKLYALNTLGAAIGCFSAGFLLIRLLGVMETLIIAAVLNLFVASGGAILSRYETAPAKRRVDEPAQSKGTLGAVSKSENGAAGYYLLACALFLSGLVSIGYEILWMRSVVHLLGGATYVFSAVLTVYLVGNVIGAGIGSRLANRVANPLAGFSISLFVLGLLGVLYLPVLMIWSSKGMPFAGPLCDSIQERTGISPIITGSIFQSVFLFLIPSITMGIGFPMALQAWTKHLHEVGRSTGLAYGANTVGAILGGILTGFVLIPFLGVQKAIFVLGLLAAWVAAIAYLRFGGSRVFSRRSPMGLALLFTLVAVSLPSDLFNIVIESNRIDKTTFSEDFELLEVKEGTTTTVSVDRDLKGGALHIYSAGQALAGDASGDRIDQQILGNLGVLLKVDAKSALSVGFGSGETTNRLSKLGLQRIDCVEIAEEVVEMSLKYFPHLNLGDRLNDEINLIYMDAKNYLRLTEEKYDVIGNDSIHPRLFAENSSLYGKEYYQCAKERLEKGGLIVSWIPTYDIPMSVVDSITGTMLEVFPYVTAWYSTSYNVAHFWLIGSNEKQLFSPSYIDETIGKAEVRASLRSVNIQDSIDVLSFYLGDEDDIKKLVGQYNENSDLHPFVEFTTDKSSPRKQLFEKYVMGLRTDTVYDHLDWTGFDEDEKKSWIESYKKHYAAGSELILSYDANRLDEKLMHAKAALAILPDEASLVEALNAAGSSVFSRGVGLIDSGQIQSALAVADMMLGINPESPLGWVLRSLAMMEMGNSPAMLNAARQALIVDPNHLQARLNMGVALTRAKRFDESAKEFETLLKLSKQADMSTFYLLRVADALANAHYDAGEISESIGARVEALEIASASGQEDLVKSAEQKLKKLLGILRVTK